MKRFCVKPYGPRNFAVYEISGNGTEELVAVTVYRKGGAEVARRLSALEASGIRNPGACDVPERGDSADRPRQEVTR